MPSPDDQVEDSEDMDDPYLSYVTGEEMLSLLSSRAMYNHRLLRQSVAQILLTQGFSESFVYDVMPAQMLAVDLNFLFEPMQ